LGNNKILIVEKKAKTRQTLGKRLKELGYNVCLASDGKDTLDIFKKEQPDLIILDIVLPKVDGYELCFQLRSISDVPIIILTALGDVVDRVTGLDLGADDYVIKPFYQKELEARIRAVLRRYHPQKTLKTGVEFDMLQLGDLIINIKEKQVIKKNVKLCLTSIEFCLLELFINNAGKSLSRSLILNNVWGYTPERFVDMRIVDVHISRLRAKLEEDPRNPEIILTVRGIGYVFQND
jgi:OmpR family response regulator RpaB